MTAAAHSVETRARAVARAFRLHLGPAVLTQRALPSWAALLLLLGCCRASAADKDEFYHHFQNFTAANAQAWEVTSPLLVDTNNRAYKLTNVLTQLDKLKSTGALAGVRPGMTMDDVVARWGKPLELWAKGFGGPRFVYKEVSLFFDPAGNSVKSIYTHDLPSLERSLLLTPKIEECLRALGNPNFRDDGTVGSQCFLIYETTNAVIKVGCVRGRLSSIQLDRPDQ